MPDTSIEKVSVGELTKHQKPTTGISGLSVGGDGYGSPPEGTFATYREMRQDPTIALARAIATAPIQLANWSWEERDAAPSGAKDWLAEHFDNLRQHLMHHVMFAMDYGFQAFEKVIELIDVGGEQRLGYRKLKPLIPDTTTIQYAKDTGAFAGLKQGDVALPAGKCFVYTNDMEGTDLYGRSRMENLRKTVWPAAQKLFEREGVYVQKASGIIPMVQYPEGSSLDRGGAEVSNFELAERLLAHLGKGNGVTMPNTMAKWVEELAVKGVSDAASMKAWLIDFLEPKTAHGAEFVQLGDRHDKLKFRAWLVPERVGMEGTHGTKAEAETHVDVALLVAELFLQDLARHVNWFLVDPLLEWNWGRQARGSVYMVPEKLVDEQKEMLRAIMRAALSANLDALNDLLNVDAAMDILGLPKAEDTVSIIDRPKPDALAVNEMLNRAAGAGPGGNGKVGEPSEAAVVAAGRLIRGFGV